MGKPMNLGAAMAILGFLLTCCLCPISLNFVSMAVTSFGRRSDIFNFYGLLFPSLVGNLSVATYVAGLQSLCASFIAFVIFLIGIISVVQTRRIKSGDSK